MALSTSLYAEMLHSLNCRYVLWWFSLGPLLQHIKKSQIAVSDAWQRLPLGGQPQLERTEKTFWPEHSSCLKEESCLDLFKSFKRAIIAL